MQVTLTQTRKGRVQIVARDGDEVRCLETLSQGDGRSWRRVAQQLGCDEPYLLGKVLATSAKEEQVFDLDSKEEGPVSIWVRGMSESRDTARSVVNFDEALATPGELIEWDNREGLCCLDIDYHHTTPPRGEWLLLTMAGLKPAPLAYWLSRNGGGHALYQAASFLRADELAAVAGLCLRSLDPTAKVELLRNTRRPTGEVYRSSGSADIGSVAVYLGSEVDSGAVAGWLDTHGLEMGESYEHDQCPVWPGESARGRPVRVTENGVYCHRCAAAGKCYGSRRPGCFPWTALAGGGPDGTIRTMARHFCHFDHARVVLEDRLGLIGDIARLSWQAILHLLHGDDVRVHRAMTAGQDMIRLNGMWVQASTMKPMSQNIVGMLRALPATQGPEGKNIEESVSRFQQPIDLSRQGYPHITPIWGIRVYSHHMSIPSEQQISMVTPPQLLLPDAYAQCRPKYVEESKRLSLDECFRILEKPFPGINRNYLLLLVAMKGIVEAQPMAPPLIVVSGASGAGKSTTVHVAAAVAGDKCSEIPWNRDSERFRQAYQTAIDTGSYVCINEIIKDAGRHGITPVEAMDVFLNITPDSMTHRLYVGSMAMGKYPCTVVTDIDFPSVIAEDIQIARRFIHVHLRGMVDDWKDAGKRAGVQKAQALRLSGDEYVEASNGIVSYVIDTFFREPLTHEEIAARLGFLPMNKEQIQENANYDLKRFYELINMQPESTERRWAGGWRVIRRGEQTELAELWGELCDGNSGTQWGQSRRIMAQDWTKLLGASELIRCETRRHGTSVGIRFLKG